MSLASSTQPPVVPLYSLDNLHPSVRNFNYNRDAVEATHLHIGTGLFSLAHIVFIANEYMNRTGKLDWGIIAASLHNNEIIRQLAEADNRVIIAERQDGEKQMSVLGSIKSTIFARNDPNSLVRTMSEQGIKLLTFTVTSGGHYMRNQHGDINLTAPEVVHDLNYNGSTGSSPKTIYWYLAAGLQLRMDEAVRSGVARPLTIMSLDNIPSNSKALKRATLQYIEASIPNSQFLIAWIEEWVDFRTTVVDRITPKDSPEFRLEVESEIGFNPPVLVATEKSWHLSAETGRFWVPDWQTIGVREVNDIEKSWQAKFFGLNAAHQILAMLGLRLGLSYIHEGMQIPELAALVELFHTELGVFLGDELMKEYGPTVRVRFRDWSVKDSNRRVCARGRAKSTERVAYAVELGLKHTNNEVVLKAPTLTFAAFLLNIGGIDQFGNSFEQDDADLPKLRGVYDEVVSWTRSATHDTQEVAQILRKIGEIFDDNRMIYLANTGFVAELAWALQELSNYDTVEAIRHLLAR